MYYYSNIIYKRIEETFVVLGLYYKHYILNATIILEDEKLSEVYKKGIIVFLEML